MATLAGLVMLCACQTITAARGDPADPPGDQRVTPAFRRELANRVLAYGVNSDRGPPPFRITKATISEPQYSSGTNLYCVSLLGGRGEVDLLVSIGYDKARNLHVKNVLGGASPREETEWCGTSYLLPEAVGRIYGRH